MTLVLDCASDQNIIGVKNVFENLFVFSLFTDATLVHSKVSHEFEPLRSLHLEHGPSIALLVPLVHSLGSLFLVVLIGIVSMQVVLGDSHGLYECI